VAAATTAKKPRTRIRDRVVWGVAGGAGQCRSGLNTRVRGLG
jgi:hypothetical protein